uniref:C-type cytochrome n=1 Tax=mine drainage metagenome TaxID=410659 RepID=E6QJV2_9ZZZZ
MLFIFISQIITGLCLALYYVPSAETAHTSVAYITKQVAAGAFLRSLHYYGSSAMIIVLGLHFLQTFLYGSFKGKRELLWISGATLSLFVLGMGFTGYLLPWDQKAYFATAVGTNIVGEIPLIGDWLTRLLRGGDTIGTLTLSRFYLAHVFLIPGVIFLFIATHIFLFRKAGAAGPIQEDPIKPKMAPEGFYPRQVLMDMTFAFLIMVGLGFLAYFHPVGLGPIANPADTHFLPRPEWYYLPMFEWLKFWEGPEVVLAVVVVPGLLAALFFLLPFMDRSLERRPWRRPIPVLAVAIVMVGIVYLGIKSEMDDRRDPSTAAQLALQAQQEKAYTAAPFKPYVEAPGGTGPSLLPSGPASPLAAQGRGIFQAHGCSGCHGEVGLGTPAAPNLTGITTKIPQPQLIELLHHPNPAMLAGHMPAVDISPNEMSALLAYLGVVGTSAGNVQAAIMQAGAPSSASGESSGAAPSAPAESSVAAASPAVAAGAQVYQDHGCIGCHGPSATGGRAPALAPLVAKLKDAQLADLIQHPNAKMMAGGMPPFFGSPAQLKSLVAYMRSLKAGSPTAAAPSQQAAAAAPAQNPAQNIVPHPDTANSKQPPSGAAAGKGPSAAAPQTVASKAPAASPGRGFFMNLGCAACHGPSGEGTHFAPSLIGISAKFPGEKLPYLLRHETAKMRAGGMPLITLKDAQLQELVSYLDSLKPAANPAPGGAAPKVAQKQAAPPAASSAAAPSAATPASTRTSAGMTTAESAALSPLAQQGRMIFQRNRCETCHGVDGLEGTVAAPALAGTASLLPANSLEDILRHHTTRMQRGGMPLTNMNAPDMKALVTYIRSMPSTGQAQ